MRRTSRAGPRFLLAPPRALLRRPLALLVMALPAVAQEPARDERSLFPAEGLACTEVASGFGSLIALAIDPAGTPIVSVEKGGLLRLHDDDVDGRYERSSVFCDELAVCQGLAFAYGDAWATGDGPQGPGFYRLRDAGDAPRTAELVAPVSGSLGEHGPHAVRLAPDGRLLVMLGNHVRLEAPVAADSPVAISYEGHVVPRLVDPNGHATDITAPGGMLHAFDPLDSSWRTVASGFRNAYDFDLAPNGDVFTFDSDMEWDIGLPWYRAVRVVHVLPGGDWGWRTGSAKWPAWYPDSLPPVLETGRGSPTGVAWCSSPAFPPAVRDTLLLGDWAQGRILSVRLTPDGISYRGRAQVLLSGRPLPVTDLEFARDGALLVTVGGRGARGALLRLTGDGSASGVSPGWQPAARPPELTAATELGDVVALLDSADLAVRYLAARELERRPTAGIDGLLEADPPRSAGARAELLVVRARQALQARDEQAAARLRGTAVSLMAGGQALATRRTAARAVELLLLVGVPDRIDGRDQPPDSALGNLLLPLFPSGDAALDRELALLLARCEPAGARAALLAALDEEPTPEEALHLLYALAALREEAPAGVLSPALQRLGALRGRPGGASYEGFLDGIERRLLGLAGRGEREELRALARPAPAPALVLSKGAPLRESERLLAGLREMLEGPGCSPVEGAWVFARTCAACHRHGEAGRGGGPDLTTVGARFGLTELLSAMAEPSRDVSDQYRSTRLLLRDGREPSGLLVRDDGTSLTLLTTVGETLEVAATDVAGRELSRLSAMPDGLLDGLSQRAIADLCAFLLDPAPPAAPERSAWEPQFTAGLDGWRAEAGDWQAEAGVLQLRAPAPEGGARLVAPWSLEALDVECELRLPAGRARLALPGVTVELGEDGWGSLREDGGRHVPSDPQLIEPALARDGWNHVRVEWREGRARVAINGLEAARLEGLATAKGAVVLHAEPGATPALRLVALRRPGAATDAP